MTFNLVLHMSPHFGLIPGLKGTQRWVNGYYTGWNVIPHSGGQSLPNCGTHLKDWLRSRADGQRLEPSLEKYEEDNLVSWEGGSPNN